MTPSIRNPQSAIQVVLYGKPGCHLCEDAKKEIEAARRERDFILTEVDVSIDPGLHRDYGERIPVIEVNGEEAFELGVERTALLRHLGTVAP
ncbi:MAG: glutaredoxin family protein [Thermoleophilaceae bacterium]